MSNWDLMMPGMGLTAIGVAGIFISYSGIAHTFVDGMHALTGLTMFVGLIFLSAGILEGGVSTSNKAKATTLVIIAIALSFGMVAVAINTISTIPVFAGIMLIIAIPAILISYVAMKYPVYAKPVSVIFILGVLAGVSAYVGFGFVGPQPYLIAEEKTIEETIEEIAVPKVAQHTVSILPDSSIQGNPDYEPDVINVPKGNVIEWINNDNVPHTVTSSLDFGETFDSGLMDASSKFTLDTSELAIGAYEYMCIVHPWMMASIIIEEPKEPVIKDVNIPQGASIEKIGQTYYDPQDITVTLGTTIKWNNNDEVMHTVTSGTLESGPTGIFDSGILNTGASFEHTFSSAEKVDYYCIVHPWMTGSVTAE
ncbi:MAG TPA: plastocyanin/azurin family copper-binding protein [Nitrosopumilaceae archaeon]|nr:plastocyanin/azurin family copper-binding protein [Nitrosopumilaceae archaeon]